MRGRIPLGLNGKIAFLIWTLKQNLASLFGNFFVCVKLGHSKRVNNPHIHILIHPS